MENEEFECMEMKVKLPKLPEGYEYTGKYEQLKDTDLYYNAVVRNVSLYFSDHGIKFGFTVRKKRWRAEGDEIYFYVNELGFINNSWDDDHKGFEQNLYECGNYFRTVEDAKASEIYQSYIHVEDEEIRQ